MGPAVIFPTAVAGATSGSVAASVCGVACSGAVGIAIAVTIATSIDVLLLFEFFYFFLEFRDIDLALAEF